MTALTMRPVLTKEAREAVARWHSHHAAHRGQLFAIGACVADELVAVVVVGRPNAPALQDGLTYEVTRLACGPDAPKYTASRLLGAARKAALSMGVRRLISYTRVDEAGTCYRASGWRPTARTEGREWTSGNKALRWLPGLDVGWSTETIDRVRWETGPAAAPEIVLVAA